VRAQVRDQVGDQVEAQVEAQVKDLWWRYIGGQFWVGYWWGSPSAVAFFREVCGLRMPNNMEAKADAWRDTCLATCWWWPFKDYIVVSERPLWIDRDAEGRLHSETRQAIQWPDGWGLARSHGNAYSPIVCMKHPGDGDPGGCDACYEMARACFMGRDYRKETAEDKRVRAHAERQMRGAS
jgi:hypothetical protein